MPPDVCPVAHAHWLNSPLRRLLHKPEKIFQGLVSEGQTAIDLGCGPGYFSLGLARMVGDSGRVIAVDIQPEMLEMVKRNAAKAGLQSRIETHVCTTDSLGLNMKTDFVLAFWMAHEVKDQTAFFRQVVLLLKPEARFLLVEPKMHVNAAAFKKTLDFAVANGLKPIGEMKIRISRAMIFSI